MNENEIQKPKILVIRLSSLGDVILASSVLACDSLSHGVDWVVASDYTDVLRGHPKIKKLWVFDRSLGLIGFIKFTYQLWKEDYDEIIDLHGTVRAWVLRLFFLSFLLLNFKKSPKWRRSSKQRFRSIGYVLLKRLWPRSLYCERQTKIFSKAAGGTGLEKPDLSFLTALDGTNDEPKDTSYVCVMPSSHWYGKTWSAKNYFNVLEQLKVFPVVLGKYADPQSCELVRLLNQAGIPHVSAIGKLNLQQVAVLLSKARCYFGSDTGLAHLSEAVGTPAIIVYGPTAPGLGFEPWHSSSLAIGAQLWCRPCGKIGDHCYRPLSRFWCLKKLTHTEVFEKILEHFKVHAQEWFKTPRLYDSH
ncbi:MAG: glycosyltransferase family 9 protein [Candidatus Poribacteria bacterium]